MRILLVEDDVVLSEWLTRALAPTGFVADAVHDGRQAIEYLNDKPYDAMVLDLGLPGADGHEVLAQIRRLGHRLPVLILTGNDNVSERVRALHGGADDFLGKPFAMEELEARLIALIRRAWGTEHSRFDFGPLSYDSAAKKFSLGERTLSLTPREHTVLRALLPHSGRPLSKQEILDRIYADDTDVMPEAVEVMIYRLRKRLEGSTVKITTLRGLGYLLEHRP
jgi:two-component system response regulator TctD